MTALEQWCASLPRQEKNPLFGKVRLGHCIYLTDEQRQRINKLRVPVEICATCHTKLNWHLKKNPHPVVRLYPEISDPIVAGPDDEAIFGASAKVEFNQLFGLFGNREEKSRQDVKIHQAQFRFGSVDN